MKLKSKILCAVLTATLTAGSVFAFSACDGTQQDKKPLTDAALQAQKIADYTKTAADRAETFASGSKGYSWENGEPFNVWWKPQNVSYEGNKLSLSLSEMKEKEQKWDEDKQQNVDCIAEYYGAEERSEHYYGYGDFQVRMKPAKIVGTASTFFTCTGPYDKWYDEDGTTVIKENKHDEIDIEFLGKDTTKVQFNYFVNGQGGHEYMYNLGFDASLEFHDYGYRWTENYITWFVDDKPVYRVDRSGDEAWPSHPGRIIMNYWCATENASAWMGKFKDDYTGKAEYEYVATSATQCPDPNTAHIKDKPPVGDDPVTLEVPTEGWVDISTDSFDGWGMYDVDKTEGLTISHSKANKDYNCCGMSLTDSYSWVKFKVKNNADAAADIRIDVKKEGGSGAVEAISPASSKIQVLAADSAAFIHLDASEELEVALKIKNVYINQIVIFLNSTVTEKAAAGSITITELKGIVNTEVTPPEPPTPITPVDPVGDNCALSFQTTEVYTVDHSGVASAEITVTYTEVVGATYKNVAAQAAELAADKDTFSLKIKNNGEAAVNLRIDLIGENTVTVGDNTAMNVTNLSATATGGTGLYTDTTWGGTMLTLAAGEEATVVITYSNDSDMGAVQRVQLYLDSATYGDTATHGGNVTFGEFKFAKSGADPEPPAPAGSSVKIGDNEATFAGDYTVAASEDKSAMTIEYSGVGGHCYYNANTSIASFVGDNDTFTFTVKNEGTETVKIRIDIGCDEADGSDKNDGTKNNFCNIKAEYSANIVESGNDYEWGGGDWVKVAAGETITVKITFTQSVAKDVKFFIDSSTYDDEATHSGKVVFSDMNLIKEAASSENA